MRSQIAGEFLSGNQLHYRVPRFDAWVGICYLVMVVAKELD